MQREADTPRIGETQRSSMFGLPVQPPDLQIRTFLKLDRRVLSYNHKVQRDIRVAVIQSNLAEDS